MYVCSTRFISVEDFQFKLKNSSSRDKFTSEESYDESNDELNKSLNEDFEFNDCKKMELSSKIESLSSLSF